MLQAKKLIEPLDLGSRVRVANSGRICFISPEERQLIVWFELYEFPLYCSPASPCWLRRDVTAAIIAITMTDRLLPTVADNPHNQGLPRGRPWLSFGGIFCFTQIQAARSSLRSSASFGCRIRVLPPGCGACEPCGSAGIPTDTALDGPQYTSGKLRNAQNGASPRTYSRGTIIFGTNAYRGTIAA